MMTTDTMPKPKKSKIDKLQNRLKKLGYEAKVASTLKTQRFIRTPFPAFNNLTGGGYPRGRYTVVAGPSQVAKTTQALQTVAYQQSLDEDFLAVFVAVEPLDREWLETLGVDLDRMIIIEAPIIDEDVPVKEAKKKGELRPGTMEWFLQQILEVLKAQVADMIVVDSIGALVPGEEESKTMAEDTMMRVPKLMGQFFRKAGPYIDASEDAPAFIWIGHVYDVPTTTGAGIQQVKGGNAVAYWAHTRILQRRSYAEADRLDKVKVMCPDGQIRDISPGWACRIKLDKSKTNEKESQEIVMPFILGRGIDSTRTTILSCFAFGLINQKGAWCRSEFIVDDSDDPKIQGKAAVVDYFMENEDQRNKLFERLNEVQAEGWLQEESTEDAAESIL